MQRGRSRKQQAPHRAPMDSGLPINASEKKPTKQPKRRSRGGKSPTIIPAPRATPSPAASPPASPDTPIMTSTPPSNPDIHPEGASDPEHETFTVPAQAGTPYNIMAPAQPTAELMMAAAAAAMYAPVQHMASKSVKRKQAPTAAGSSAAGFGSSKGAKRPKSGPGSLPLKPGLCSFCEETSSPMWRKGPEEYKRLCNRCGMRWSRNKNDPDKAFNAKVLAKIKAERLREQQQVAAELITEDSGFSEAFAATGPLSHVHSLPTSAHPPSLSQQAAAQQAYTAFYNHSVGSNMDVAAAAAAVVAAAGLDSDSQEDAPAAAPAAAEEGGGVERSAEPAGRSHRARRATEKGAALQSRVRRSRTPRKAAGGEARPSTTALLDMLAKLYADVSEMQGNDDEDSHEQYSDDYEEQEEEPEGYNPHNYEDEPHSTMGRGQPPRSRLARTTFAHASVNGATRAAAASGGDAGGRFRGLEALLAAASAASMEDGEDGSAEMMSDDGSGLPGPVEAPAPTEHAQLQDGAQAVTHAQQPVTYTQQAAAPARLISSGHAGNPAAAATASQAAKRDAFQSAQDAYAAAPAAPAPPPPAPVGNFANYPTQQQAQPQHLHQQQYQNPALHFLMQQFQHQPAAIQVVLQQPALLAPAHILMQGNVVNFGAAPNLPMVNPQPQLNHMHHVNQAPLNQPPAQPAGQPQMAPSDLLSVAATLGHRQAQGDLQLPQHLVAQLVPALMQAMLGARPASSGGSDGAAYNLHN